MAASSVRNGKTNETVEALQLSSPGVGLIETVQHGLLALSNLKKIRQVVDVGNVMANPENIQAVIQAILKKLVSEYSPQTVILFGSYAYGTPGPDSDIDLLIVKETSQRFIDRWVTVHQILTGTHRSLPLETLVLTPKEVARRLAVGDQFIGEILEKGQVLYAA